MSKLADLEAKSRMTFPRPLTASQVRQMFDYISKRGIYETGLTVTQSEKYEANTEPVKDVTAITGTVTQAGHIMRSASFKLSREIDLITDASIFTRLQFETIPGYGIKEHRAEEVAIWDGVRGEVLEYFSQR